MARMKRRKARIALSKKSLARRSEMAKRAKTETNADDLQWNRVSEKMARTILEQGRAYLQAQLDISLASDRRAITIATVFTTVSTGVLGVTISQAGSNISLLSAGLAISLFMLIAAAHGFYAARSITFFAPGNHPSQWWQYRRENLVRMIGGETENYQARIEHNERCLAANANVLQRGHRFAISAPATGFIVWLAANFISSL